MRADQFNQGEAWPPPPEDGITDQRGSLRPGAAAVAVSLALIVAGAFALPLLAAVNPLWHTGVFKPASSPPKSFAGGAAATLLEDGKVLITGGVDVMSMQNEASAELYDPTTGRFQSVGSMSMARSGHTATRLEDGEVLIAGGMADNGPVASAELFDPTMGRFIPTGSMAEARDGASATLLQGGKVLVSGGDDKGSAELYDPKTRSFGPTGSLVDGCAARNSTLLDDGRVLITGCGYYSGPSAEAEIYDPKAGIFSRTGSMTTARNAESATLLGDGRVLLAGGEGIDSDLASAELFDPKTGSFSPTGSMALVKSFHSATLLKSGQVLVAGGAAMGQEVTATAELYDPRSGTFHEILGPFDMGNQASWTWQTGPWELFDPPMCYGVVGQTQTLLDDGRVLIVGGDINTGNSAQLYVP
ncbi:MAG TPA: kelch repeat-containing protein [Candidatus Limnocylindrales bacterium]